MSICSFEDPDEERKEPIDLDQEGSNDVTPHPTELPPDDEDDPLEKAFKLPEI